MLKQTVFLFIRALIIGVLLNLGVQQFSETTSTLSHQEPGTPAQMQSSIDQVSSGTSIHLPGIGN